MPNPGEGRIIDSLLLTKTIQIIRSVNEARPAARHSAVIQKLLGEGFIFHHAVEPYQQGTITRWKTVAYTGEIYRLSGRDEYIDVSPAFAQDGSPIFIIMPYNQEQGAKMHYAMVI